MSGREQSLAEEVARQQALVWVERQLAESWREMAEALADNLAAVLICLTDCGVLVRGGQTGPHGDEEYWWAQWPADVTEDESSALADAIRGARAALDEMHEATEGVS